MEDEKETEAEKLSQDGEDEVDFPPNHYVFRVVDIFFIIGGLITFFADWGLDMLTAYIHWRNNLAWFSLTVIFICVPSLIMSAVSLHWYVKDSDKESSEFPPVPFSIWLLRIFFLVLQLAPVLRSIDSLYYGLKSRQAYKEGNKTKQRECYMRMLYEDSDATLLRLFECFMESAPQLVLQMYILTRPHNYKDSWVFLISLSTLSSLGSLAWGITAYNRASRFTNMDKENLSLFGSVVHFMWQFFSIGARVIAMVLFASEFRLWLLAICFGHWLVMCLWVMARKSLSHVCSSRCGELILSMVLGAVYIFAFINERDEPTRYKYATYYVILEMENLVMLSLWIVKANPTLWYFGGGIAVHLIFFILGLVLMILYYGYLHPSKPHALILREERKRKLKEAAGAGAEAGGLSNGLEVNFDMKHPDGKV